MDYTSLPRELEAKFSALDEDSALRPTIINVGKQWTKRSKKGLLSDFTTSGLQKAEQKLEKQRCYDLLDALVRLFFSCFFFFFTVPPSQPQQTKSGVLSIEGATLHVIMTATVRIETTRVSLH